jgi:hypothetical protein
MATIKPATLNDFNLSLNTLDINLQSIIKKQYKKILEQESTAPTETDIKSRKDIIYYFKALHAEDAKKYGLTYFRTIKCKDINGKSALILLYTIDNIDLNNILYLERDPQAKKILYVLPTRKYAIFKLELYQIDILYLLDRLTRRYGLNVDGINTP